MLKISEAAEYIGMGKTKARAFLEGIGAKWQIGRCVRYDIRVIDRHFNETGTRGDDESKNSNNDNSYLCGV